MKGNDGLRKAAQRGIATPLVLGVLLGALMGIGLFTFGYARGSSYMTDDPEACANCHVMNEQYEGWLKGSHRKAAVCNDCHTPPGLVPKYTTKAVNGFFHSLAFTTGHYPDEIYARPRNAGVTEKSCLKCHEDVVHGVRSVRGDRQQDVACVSCHRTVGHQ